MATMNAGAASDVEPRPAHSRSLVLALIGELHLAGHMGPYRAVDLIGVLESAGVSAPAARAALDRLVVRGVLARERGGQGVCYRLTPNGGHVIAEGSARVHAVDPFAPSGDGWTLVTFSVPEGRRSLRRHLRSALTWAGFAPLRDGVWVAAGERDPLHALDAFAPELRSADIAAFRAHELTGFSMAERVGSAWNLEAIRSEHERFLSRWMTPDPDPYRCAPLAAMTLLVADWLELLRQDPSLPSEYLGTDWPAQRSTEVYAARRAELADAASAAASTMTPKPAHGVRRRESPCAASVIHAASTLSRNLLG